VGRRAVVAVLTVTCAALALVCLRTVREAESFIHPPRSHLAQNQRAEAQALLPNLESIELHTRDGLRLEGWFSPGRARSAVALIHGLSANRAELLPEAALLAHHGHGVLLIDSRASGESEGDLATWGDCERLDVLAALDFLSARPDVEPGRIGLYGFSVGSAAVALVASTDPRVQAAGVAASWPSMRAALANEFPALEGKSATLAAWIFRWSGIDVDAVRPMAAVRLIVPRALLLVTGAEDSDTPPAVVEALAANAPGSSVWIVPRGRHGHYGRTDPTGLEQHFACFFDLALIPAFTRCPRPADAPARDEVRGPGARAASPKTWPR
jgi:dipeptidyl aminopeptidase/acylaminoacyl peptidase